MSSLTLDAVDWRILDVLQQDARIANVDLAKRVHLSASPCLARVRKLEQAGLIRRHVTLLDPIPLGLTVSVFIQVRLEKQVERALDTFEQAIRDVPEIHDCFYVAGTNDYLLRFTYRDAEDLEHFHSHVLSSLPGVTRSNSMLVLRTVKKTTALPMD
jgi:DNA-binding Lrp family transcriptional regulator